jgi:hypothetical protein
MEDHDVEEEQNKDEEAAEELGCTARVEVRWASKMSETDRLAVADWLRTTANNLVSEGHNYAALFTASLDPED